MLHNTDTAHRMCPVLTCNVLDDQIIEVFSMSLLSQTSDA